MATSKTTSAKTSFNERFYALLRTVPRGKVTTYKALANELGTAAYRAVGNAMNKNPDAPRTPCHRVINADGRLGGFASGLEKKKRLLAAENVKIENDRIDLDKYGYFF